ncbi:substrate-binding domain-containing protein [Inquilinus sp. CA228]|uniref:substrate-binding domain-containing protein n=1 Tax=Inquilinus sp. CA228 TaxID=3455609 RepID=UPI003F8D6FB6
MSKLLKSCSLLALAVGGLTLNSAPASAAAYYSGGATLPFGVYLRWFQETNGGIALGSCVPSTTQCFAYAPTGSGAGITAFINEQSMNAVPSDTPYENASIPYAETPGNGYGAGGEFFDFAGSDAVLTATNISNYNAATGPLALRGPAIQVPTVGSPVAIAFNPTGLTIDPDREIPAGAKSATGGSSALYLSRRAYCGIFTGTITNWNDPILTADNLGTPLVAVSTPINVVVRQESSGTTFLFTRHLEAACNGAVDNSHPANPGNLANYSFGVGTGGPAAPITWPAGFTRATGSNGVAAAVDSTSGAIGYVSADYTAQAISPEIASPPPAANLQRRDSFDAGTDVATPGGLPLDLPIPPAPTYTQNSIDGLVIPAIDTTAPFTNDALWSAALDAAALHNPHDDTVAPIFDPANPEAYPIAGFTMLNFYSCYFPATETTAIRKFITDYTNGGVYDTAARNRGFAPLTASIKTAVKNLALNTAATQIRTGPSGTFCTIATGS